MPGPLASLALVVAALAAATILLRPQRGVVWRWLEGRAASDRVRVEDALKHLWDGEYRRQPITLQSLAGALGIAGQEAAELVTRLERLDLVRHEGENLLPTQEGRRHALRVIRIHRLWERYLADQTGFDAPDWHAQAERREHRTSAEQAEAMAASLGDPRYDPHGDPIPLPSGEIPPARGVPLNALPAGAVAEVVHVEDEPEAVFAQIVAAGLAPGVEVRLLENTPSRLRLAADAEEIVLAPVVAANLTVVPMAAPRVEAPTALLSVLRPGERAEVVGISAACFGPQRRRLLDLGVVPGTVIEHALQAPSGDPTAYRIRGAMIALRREQANLVRVHRIEKEAS